MPQQHGLQHVIAAGAGEPAAHGHFIDHAIARVAPWVEHRAFRVRTSGQMWFPSAGRPGMPCRRQWAGLAQMISRLCASGR